MEVRDIFELRKQGKIEEAYAAIRPMYAAHKGKYTTLAMFWTASDILRKRLSEKRHEESVKIFEALLRILPNISDDDHRAHSSITSAALRLCDEVPGWSMLDFIEKYGVENLTEADWEVKKPTDDSSTTERKFDLPSTGQRILTHCFHEFQQQPTADNALKMMPLLEEAMRRQPRNKHNRRYMAVIYGLMGNREKAVEIYKDLLQRSHDSWLYAELAELTDDAGERAALLCRAIMNQRQEKFRSGYHLSLAKELLGRDDARAAHELQRCLAIRQSLGFHPTRETDELAKKLEGVKPVTLADEQMFYRKMAEKFKV